MREYMLLYDKDFCGGIYLVNGSAFDIQKSNPLTQLRFQFFGLFPNGSRKGQLICMGPFGEDVALSTAESIVVRTSLAEISSVGGGRLKNCLTNVPK